MERIEDFHTLLVYIITAISLFVLALLLWVMFRYNSRANPVPSKVVHNTTLEIVWTIMPVIILVLIAIPSFRLLYFEADIPNPDLTIKAIGKQWYWTYEYPGSGNFQFDSLGLSDADAAKADEPRLLGVDNVVVVPVNKVVMVRDDRRRRDPFLGGSGFRREDGRRSRPHQQDLVQGDQGRHLLRRMLRTLRRAPCLHAHRGESRFRARL